MSNRTSFVVTDIDGDSVIIVEKHTKGFTVISGDSGVEYELDDEDRVALITFLGGTPAKLTVNIPQPITHPNIFN
jgi:hypothetical protein